MDITAEVPSLLKLRGKEYVIAFQLAMDKDGDFAPLPQAFCATY